MNNNILDGLLKKLNSLKDEGNSFLSNEKYDLSISVYEKALDMSVKYMNDYIKLDTKDIKDKEKINEINLTKKKILSNMSLAYFKLKNYEKSIELDKAIISIDVNYDKAYSRLYLSYKNLNLMNVAIEYGNHLINDFDTKTIEKYKDIVEETKKYKEDKIFNEKLKKYEIIGKRY
ncbi:MAG: hypothetical protein MJ252_25380, partial [archaeon]|nr:hypothetical protein [archaeon]